jgi:hypothetical protein
MLIELYELSQSLKSVGIQLESWHPYLKECPRSGQTFGVYIDPNSAIKIVRPLEDQQVAMLRKYEKSAGNSFPCFNLLPLWCIAGPDGRDRDEKISRMTAFRKSLSSKKPPEQDEIIATIRELITQCRSLWIDPNKKARGRDESDKVNTCLANVTDEIAKAIGDDPKLAALKSLLERVRKFDATSLHQQMSEYLLMQCESQSDKTIKFFDILFVGGGKAKSSSFMFDVSDFQNYENPVNHVSTYQSWSRSLFTLDSSPKKVTSRSKVKDQDSVVHDAFGEVSEGHDQSFPQVKMSRFGNINLRAMSSESLCQKRYRVADAKSFVVSSFNRQAMKNALEWLSRDERQGKTWRDLTTENGGVATVLFAYTRGLVESPAEIADFLGGNQESTSIQNQKGFEAITKTITDAVQGLLSSNANDDVCVFVLTKPDGYRCKVHFSSRFTTQHLLQSATNWERGCLNLPSIKIRQFTSDNMEKGVNPELLSPSIPFPMQLISCVSTVWRRLGSESSPTKSVHIADALSLLLDSGKELESTTTQLLRLLLQNTTGLLLATGQAAVLGRVHSVAKNLQKHQLLLPSILGLLLSKLGYSKEIYMKTGAFWVGRFLSAVDQLHCLYCEDVRGGSFPPQFVGNAMMTAALSNPENAMSQLADRTKPYVAWAKTTKGDKMKLAKYWLGQLSDISNEISERTIPSRCTDAERAAMLIGYLSRPDKVSKESEQNGEKIDE